MATPKRSSFAINALTTNYGVPALRAYRSDTAWTKPIMGSYKMNIDASFYNNGTGVVGAFLCNSRGETIAGSFGPLDHILSTMTSEAQIGRAHV